MAPGQILPYPGGLSRGTTPPTEIPTTGAGNKTAINPQRIAEQKQGAPFACDANLPMPQRYEGMSLRVLKKEDCPPGPLLCARDHDRSLTTSDIPRARPLLSHPISGVGDPVPWKQLTDRPQGEERYAMSRAKTHYPPVAENRPRDLSLRTDGIEKAQPKKTSQTGRGRDPPCDPVRPTYRFPPCDGLEPLGLRGTGKCSLDVSDIEFTAPTMQIPYRREYGDPLRLEDEFRSRDFVQRRKAAEAAAASWSASGGAVEMTAAAVDLATGTATGSKADCDPPRRPKRHVDPQDPRYAVHVTTDTSICAKWAEEPHAPPSCTLTPRVPGEEEYGCIERSKPSSRIHAKNDPQYSLETGDVSGAQSARKVGHIVYSIYGPQGVRPAQSTNLTTGDIHGAQAGTHARGPKSTHKRVGANIIGMLGTIEVPNTSYQEVGWALRPAGGATPAGALEAAKGATPRDKGAALTPILETTLPSTGLSGSLTAR
eukprot:TRINITY_DN24997_c0_g1_i1.p1 TRINITY_DN24997_c0_g1~~TRINITY_DN24997_c0_g1_i1.p1  ORF type:complete len:484 (+),score=79.41 TRINITY_DN24997_c0_g1_i1:76-1527(+)